MQFYRPLFRETWRLAMASPAVQSGFLWSAFPWLATLVFLLLFIVFLGIFGWKELGLKQLRPLMKRIIPSLLSATAVSILGLVFVLVYEAYRAPYAVLENVSSQAAAAARTDQTATDKRDCSDQVAVQTTSYDAQVKELKNALAATPVYVTIDRYMEFWQKDRDEPIGPLTTVQGHTTFVINLSALVTITNSQDHAMTIRSFRWQGESHFCPVSISDSTLYMVTGKTTIRPLNTVNSLERRLLKGNVIEAHHAISGYAFFQCKDLPCFRMHQSLVIEDTEGHSFSASPNVNDLGMMDRINTVPQPPMLFNGSQIAITSLGHLEASQCN